MKKSAFTLIELLIVIAIIAILALIAVPNFLEAQTRAKFARCLADMRAICTAVDQLRMDTGYMPIDGWDDDTPEGRRILREVFKGVGDFPEAIRSTTHYLAVLTSPIGYLSQVPVDPFLPANHNPMSGSLGFGSPYDTYIYADVDPAILAAAPNNWNQGIQALNSSTRGGVAEQYGIKPLQVGEYALIGVGPSGKAGIGTGGVGDHRGLPYSPTNGTVSAGDVVMRTGGRVDFEN